MTIEADAPAKVNLTLHVTGRRPDGYHLLDSLVAFAEPGDRLRIAPAGGGDISLTIGGDAPGARALARAAPSDNLILRAARLLARADGPAGPPPGARIALEKRLPVGAGLGGGSSDAAAALRGLARLWGRALPAPSEVLALGADVPVCLLGRPARMRGIGERLDPLALPRLHLVLAHPGVGLSTARVFSALGPRANPPMPETLPRWRGAADFARWLATMRNDLAAPARAICPEIAALESALAAAPGCLLARMSGSGASCFGIFESRAAAEAAAAALSRANPAWWVRPASTLGAPPGVRGGEGA